VKLKDLFFSLLSVPAWLRRLSKKGPAGQRVFSKIDYYRLQNILCHQQEPAYASRSGQMAMLRQMLLDGQVCPCKEVPADLVTMNSVLKLQSRRGSVFTITLVYPRDANNTERKFSVLSRAGLDLVGKRLGDRFLRHMQITDILYQPESTGKFYV
jgi:regulator of nucleoside diphosphate kinase